MTGCRSLLPDPQDRAACPGAHRLRCLVHRPQALPGGDRAAIELFEQDGARVKVNPLATWSSAELKAYMAEHGLTAASAGRRGLSLDRLSALHDQGEAGRGRALGAGAASTRTECGVHLGETDGKRDLGSDLDWGRGAAEESRRQCQEKGCGGGVFPHGRASTPQWRALTPSRVGQDAGAPVPRRWEAIVFSPAPAADHFGPTQIPFPNRVPTQLHGSLEERRLRRGRFPAPRRRCRHPRFGRRHRAACPLPRRARRADRIRSPARHRHRARRRLVRHRRRPAALRRRRRRPAEIRRRPRLLDRPPAARPRRLRWRTPRRRRLLPRPDALSEAGRLRCLRHRRSHRHQGLGRGPLARGEGISAAGLREWRAAGRQAALGRRPAAAGVAQP